MRMYYREMCPAGAMQMKMYYREMSRWSYANDNASKKYQVKCLKIKYILM